MHAHDSILFIHVDIPQVIAHLEDDSLPGIPPVIMADNRQLHQKFIPLRAEAVGKVRIAV